MGGVFRRGYATECTKALGADARKVEEISAWVDESFHEFTSATKDSRQRVTFFFFNVV